MRKYDIRNKRNIGIIIGISILIIVMFSLAIRYFTMEDHNEYTVESSSLVFDKDRSIVKLDSEGTIKMKWNNEYYLTYNNEDTELGETALSYNEESGEIHLYGRYYEISSSDEINITSDETVIKSTSLTKFYKLGDRKYLVIDKNITSSDGLLSTTDFLMIDIDKVGNATLTNHKVNLKSFSNTTIVTSNYTFDIANEILTFGSDKIDLKKIIGSSNTYTKEDLTPSEEENNAVNNIVDNSTDNTDSTETTVRNTTVIEEVKKETKTTSIVSVTSTVNKITVDYVIYDPKKEYASVYMEVQREGSNSIDTIYLSSNATVYELTNNILPNTTYTLTFKYSYIDDNNNVIDRQFDKVSITTKTPSVSLKVTRTTSSRVYYLISSDGSYDITSGVLSLYVNNEEKVSNVPITINGNTTGYIDMPKASDNDYIELRLSNVSSNGNVIKDLEASYKFRY